MGVLDLLCSHLYTMKAFFSLLCLAIVAMASARNVHVKIDQLEYGFCDGSAEPASIDALAVEPFPIVIATGETITLTVEITLNEVVPVGAQVSLKIRKEGVIDIPFPCLTIDGLHIGSCDYDGDSLLEAGADTLCPTYFPDGQECKLPLKPGTYGGGDPLVLGPLPEIPSVIGDLLASGTYYADATITTADGTQMACLFIRVELAGH